MKWGCSGSGDITPDRHAENYLGQMHVKDKEGTNQVSRLSNHSAGLTEEGRQKIDTGLYCSAVGWKSHTPTSTQSQSKDCSLMKPQQWLKACFPFLPDDWLATVQSMASGQMQGQILNMLVWRLLLNSFLEHTVTHFLGVHNPPIVLVRYAFSSACKAAFLQILCTLLRSQEWISDTRNSSVPKFILGSVTATLFLTVLPRAPHPHLSPQLTHCVTYSSVLEMSDPWEPHLPQAWVAACIYSQLGKEVSGDTQIDHLGSRQGCIMSKHHDPLLLIRTSSYCVIQNSIFDKMFCQNLKNDSKDL